MSYTRFPESMQNANTRNINVKNTRKEQEKPLKVNRFYLSKKNTILRAFSINLEQFNKIYIILDD